MSTQQDDEENMSAEEKAIRKAIDWGGGPAVDAEGVIRELAKAGFVIVRRPS